MSKKFKILIIGLAVFGVVSFVVPVHAAYILERIPACMKDGQCTPCSVMRVILTVADMIVKYSSVAALVMVIFGGAIMLTAWGNENRLAMGKKAVVAALVGVAIIFTSWTIVNTIITGSVTGGFSKATGGRDVSSWNSCPEEYDKPATTTLPSAWSQNN